MNLTDEQMNELKEQGFSEEEINQAVENQELDPQEMSQQSSFLHKPDENLIKWQLELNDILERAEHILRGDVPRYYKGVLIWAKSKDPSKNPLNEWGVQEVMKILAMYINRNTILSDYDKVDIQWKVFDFGRRLNNLIFMKYDEFGMDTEEKRKNYEILVGEMVDIVHSAYNRALNGGERRSLREMINVSQQHNTAGLPGQPAPHLPKERSILNPMRALKGRYVNE